MNMPNPQWLLFIVSLPTLSGTGRMRIWRTLKASGSGALRDGTYLLPNNDAHVQLLRALSDETRREGGNAWLLTVQPQSPEEHAAFCALFDRSADYAELLKSLSQARTTLADLAPQAVSRLLRKFRKEYDALRAIDYLPNQSSAQADAVWTDFVSAAQMRMSAGEPKATAGAIQRLDPSVYQRRLWATRRHLWVDRVASAWLIQRFIDRDARFVWLDTPADCPHDALGFDFDGAAFTHIGERVTFEVLLASFGLEQDRGLQRIAAIVHALDVGGAPVPEASGFEAILAGARQRAADDDQLQAEIGVVLDALHTHFSNTSQA